MAPGVDASAFLWVYTPGCPGRTLAEKSLILLAVMRLELITLSETAKRRSFAIPLADAEAELLLPPSPSGTGLPLCSARSLKAPRRRLPTSHEVTCPFIEFEVKAMKQNGYMA